MALVSVSFGQASLFPRGLPFLTEWPAHRQLKFREQARRPLHCREPAAPGAIGDVPAEKHKQQKSFKAVQRRRMFDRWLFHWRILLGRFLYGWVFAWRFFLGARRLVLRRILNWQMRTRYRGIVRAEIPRVRVDVADLGRASNLPFNVTGGNLNQRHSVSRPHPLSRYWIAESEGIEHQGSALGWRKSRGIERSCPLTTKRATACGNCGLDRHPVASALDPAQGIVRWGRRMIARLTRLTAIAMNALCDAHSSKFFPSGRARTRSSDENQDHSGCCCCSRVGMAIHSIDAVHKFF